MTAGLTEGPPSQAAAHLCERRWPTGGFVNEILLHEAQELSNFRLPTEVAWPILIQSLRGAQIAGAYKVT